MEREGKGQERARTHMKMPFGKYRGRELDAVPESYLRWLRENISLREPLASAVDQALDDSALSTSLSADLKPVVRELVTAGYRALSQKYHPDRGGSHQAMVKLNAAKEWLGKRAA